MSANKTPRLGENVWAQIDSGAVVGESFLKERPPLGIEQNGVIDPVRDRLLAHRGMPGLPEASGNGGLAAGDLYETKKRSNLRGSVSFIHEHRKYTRILVRVNKDDCLTVDKAPCNVVSMPTTKRKIHPARETKVKRVKMLDRGPDGLTFPQRLSSLMAERGIGQTELAKRCSQLYSSFFPDAPDDKVKQQHIFNATGSQSSSEFLPLMAVVLDVNELWLQFGVGPKIRGS